MFISHTPLAYLVGRDHCADILDLMTPIQLLIAFLRTSGHSDADIARILDLDPTTVTRAMDTLARRIGEELPELRVLLDGRPRCRMPQAGAGTTPCPQQAAPPAPQYPSFPQANVGATPCPRQAALPPPPTPDPLFPAEALSVSQVAERLHQSPRTVRLWCRQGLFPHAYKAGRPWRIPETDLAHAPPATPDESLPSAPEPLPSTSAETLSVHQVAQRLSRKPQTIMTWCRQGLLPGAYRDPTLPYAPWRIPESALAPHLPPDDHLTVAEAARRLHTTPRSIRNRCRLGHFPGAYRDRTRPRAPWRIPAEALPTL